MGGNNWQRAELAGNERQRLAIALLSVHVRLGAEISGNEH